MIMLAPFSGPWLVCTTKVYPGLGADIVMESITPTTLPHQPACWPPRWIGGTIGRRQGGCEMTVRLLVEAVIIVVVIYGAVRFFRKRG
jgi:hypothetical protein